MRQRAGGEFTPHQSRRSCPRQWRQGQAALRRQHWHLQENHSSSGSGFPSSAHGVADDALSAASARSKHCSRSSASSSRSPLPNTMRQYVTHRRIPPCIARRRRLRRRVARPGRSIEGPRGLSQCISASRAAASRPQRAAWSVVESLVTLAVCQDGVRCARMVQTRSVRSIQRRGRCGFVTPVSQLSPVALARCQ